MKTSRIQAGWATALISIVSVSALLAAGCSSLFDLTATNASDSIGNPFATLTENGLVEANIETESSEISTGAAVGEDANLAFRDRLTVTFINNATDRELSTNFIAWVEPGNVRTETQRDSLISSGYIEIEQGITLGAAYSLVAGTFVYQGSGGSGLERVQLGASGAGQTVIPSELVISLVTPDVLLVYLDPPVSCASTAFRFLDEGDLITEVFAGGLGGTDGAVIFGSASNTGPNKTLGQIDVYSCDPFQPGMFFRQGGGLQQSNEFIEGDDITFTFLTRPVDENGNISANGNACLVTTGGAAAVVSTEDEADG